VYEHSGIVEDRIYLGGYEIYRRTVGATLSLERQTLHVNDDTKRIVLFETKTIDTEHPAGLPQIRSRWQLDNHLGSAGIELNDNAQVISNEEYHPFGSTSFHTLDSGAEVSVKRYRYTGKERDDETGLYYYGARYYASWLGRWTGCDPSVEDGWNLYVYVRNNPVISFDPNGKETKKSTVTKVLDVASDFVSGVGVSLIYNNVKPVEMLTQPPVKYNRESGQFEKNSRIDQTIEKVDSSKSGSLSYQVGRLTGDLIGLYQSYNEFVAGMGMTTAGLAGAPETAGLSLGVSVAGVAVMGNAAGVGVTATNDIAERLTKIGAMAMAAIKSGGGSEDNVKKPENSSNEKELKYKLDENDVDWRGTGKNVDDALEEAFKKTGFEKNKFEITKWGKGKYGKSHPVEWKGPNGSEVNIDIGHYGVDKKGNWVTGPDVSHVGWQVGKKATKKVGHILLDNVPFNRN
jgi:RHS repeat-associated protein